MALTKEEKTRANTEKIRRLRAAHPERYRAASRAFYHRHKERLGMERKERRAIPAHRERIKANNRRIQVGRYGLSIEQYEKMFTEQGGVCAICRQPEKRMVKGTPASLAIDHNHDTNAVRGLLCNTCNVGIGMFRGNGGLLETAIAYLNKYENTL